MADFFFFTDIDLLNNQTVQQSFGPVSGDESSKYRLLNFHSSSSDSGAYAVCKGQVFAQQNASNSALVNLVLMPAVRPDADLRNVDYFIYMGNTIIVIIGWCVCCINWK